VDVRTPEKVDLSKYIEVRLFEQRPHIRGRRIPVATIAHSARSQNWGVAELASQFTLSEVQVLAALLYYEEHKDEIESQETAYRPELDEAYRLHGTKD
jgi:uncharacterized protein (DUF433 family)